MYYKGIIFDLDDTLYNYTECHAVALRTCIEFLCSIARYEYDSVFIMYTEISKQLKYELPGVASSHNKSIYFKQLLEKLGVSYSHYTTINDMYWRTFYETMRPFCGVCEFIKWNRNIGVKIGILTDYETEYQIIKLEKLGLLDLVDYIVTSEEIGIEKPSCRAFLTILDRMKLIAEDVCMIGDNYEKDILGASGMGIFGLWFCQNVSASMLRIPADGFDDNTKSNIASFCLTPYSHCSSFSSYEVLLDESKHFYGELLKFVEISRYCGERSDLVQAGGGNVSVKVGGGGDGGNGNKMIIKSSGICMANVDVSCGFSIIDNRALKKDMEGFMPKDVNEYTLSKKMLRPSIETYMHSILKTFTVHLHPIQVNRILITTDSRKIISELFPDALVMDYYTPGVVLAKEIAKLFCGESVIFLINHGIIITTDDYGEIQPLLEGVLTKCEQYLGLDFAKYKCVNKISRHFSTYEGCYTTYLATNRDIYYFLENNRGLFSESHTFPDALIYCGMRILFIKDFGEFAAEIDLYRQTYFELPKIIIYNACLYIVAKSYQKCKEIEDVLVANLWILHSDSEKQYLSDSEIQFLNEWDAEKYRKTL